MAFLTLEKDIKETKKTILKNTELIQMEIGEIIKNQEIIKEKEFKSV